MMVVTFNGLKSQGELPDTEEKKTIPGDREGWLMNDEGQEQDPGRQKIEVDRA